MGIAGGCSDPTPPSEAGSTGVASTGGASGDEASDGPTPMLDEPYGACAGDMASTECNDAGFATCVERDDDQGIPYSVCAVPCAEEADCPVVQGGNTSPTCAMSGDVADGRCVITCHVDGVNSCPTGTRCVEGDPSVCMWPADDPGHPDAQSFCETACGPCGATLLLPWSGDCIAECLDDLADCSEPEQEEIFGCTGGETCPAGGAIVADCLMPVACVMGTA